MADFVDWDGLGVDWGLNVPYGYNTRLVSLGWLSTALLDHHHPEYVRRLLVWLNSKAGLVGVGGGWRDDGTQPDKAGFAPEGQSFHQNQLYDDGFVGACAVDLVKRNPYPGGQHQGVYWSDTIVQGTFEAKTWGLHCNVGVPPDGEPWHMQPVEIDGWQSWRAAGSPAPVFNYPIPIPVDPWEGLMNATFRMKGFAEVFHVTDGVPMPVSRELADVVGVDLSKTVVIPFHATVYAWLVNNVGADLSPTKNGV